MRFPWIQLGSPRRLPSIELRAGLRYTGSQLRMVDRAFPDPAPGRLAAIEFILNISKA
jgi:hypothetical protein